MTSQNGKEAAMELMNSWGLRDDNFDWMTDALCKGMGADFFHPEKGNNYHQVKRIKELCATCPVKEDCLQFAYNNSITFGFWGGMSPAQRKRGIAKIRRERKVAG